MRLLFVCPVLEIRFEWFDGFIRLWEDLRKHQGWEIGLYMPHRKPCPDTENEMVKIARRDKFEYILRMDDDIWDVPPGAVDKLLEADKDFISGVMYAHGFPFQKCAFRKKHPETNLVTAMRDNVMDLAELDGKGVQPCDLTAFPFTLFKTSMFDKLTAPYFVHDEQVNSDNYFCQKCLDAGIQPYAHMDVLLTHRGVSFWNRMYYLAAEGRQRIIFGNLKPGDFVYDIVIEAEAYLKKIIGSEFKLINSEVKNDLGTGDK